MQPILPMTDFTLVDIRRLRHHECVREDRTAWMMKSLKSNNEYFGPPIVVEKSSYVILEGHHRVNSLKRMGYRKVPAALVSYNRIEVKSWCSVIPERFAEKFRLEPSKLGLKKAISLLWKGRLGAGIIYCGRKVYASGIRSSLDMRTLARKFAESYVADDKVRNIRGKAIVIPAPISKRLIVKEALSGKRFPPKSTRHVLPKMKKIRVPLERLK